VLRSSQDLVGPEPDLPQVGLDGWATEKEVRKRGSGWETGQPGKQVSGYASAVRASGQVRKDGRTGKVGRAVSKRARPDERARRTRQLVRLARLAEARQVCIRRDKERQGQR